jgi:hypothetical protein
MVRSGTFQTLSSLAPAGSYSIEHKGKSQELWRFLPLSLSEKMVL